MKKWWCQGCFLPCDECREEMERILGPDFDEGGELKVKTVDLRRKKDEDCTEFRPPTPAEAREMCREMLKTTRLYEYFQRRRLIGR